MLVGFVCLRLDPELVVSVSQATASSSDTTDRARARSLRAEPPLTPLALAPIALSDINPKDYRAWYGLGQAYEILQMHLYAIYYYRRATALRCVRARACGLFISGIDCVKPT